MINFMSLFAGIGGFDLGFERAGMTPVAQCEIDPWCQKVLKKHWPDVPLYDDVTELTWEQLKNDGIESIELVCGGFPCQPFSLAGRRNGTKDDRHLWPAMLRIIDEVRPAWVVGENVAGIASMEQFEVLFKMESKTHRFKGSYDDFEAVYLRETEMLLDGIIKDLEKIGYSVQSFTIPACAVDAQHRRDRLWIVAHTEKSGNLRGSGEISNKDEKIQQRFKMSEFINSSKAYTPVQNAGCALRPRGKIRKNIKKENKRRDANKSERPGSASAPILGNTSSNSHRNELRPKSLLDRDMLGSSGRNEKTNKSTGPSEDVSDTTCPRPPIQDGFKNSCEKSKSFKRRESFRICSKDRPIKWPAEPRVGRVANGIPRRVDRLRGLGNAVVPQIPEIIGRAIMAIENGEIV